MDEVSRSYDEWHAGGYPSPDTVKEVLQSVSTLSELIFDAMYVQDGDDEWKILPVSVAQYTYYQSIPAPSLAQLAVHISINYGRFSVFPCEDVPGYEAWCRGYHAQGRSIVDALLRLYGELLSDKRKREDRAPQSDRMEEDPAAKLRDEFLKYGWEPCAPDGTDIFCAEKLFGDAYNEARHIVIVQDADGMWHAEVYNTTPNSICLKTTSKYRSHVVLLQRLNEMMQHNSLDDPNDR